MLIMYENSQLEPGSIPAHQPFSVTAPNEGPRTASSVTSATCLRLVDSFCPGRARVVFLMIAKLSALT
jgi:hypothetical protein